MSPRLSLIAALAATIVLASAATAEPRDGGESGGHGWDGGGPPPRGLGQVGGDWRHGRGPYGPGPDGRRPGYGPYPPQGSAPYANGPYGYGGGGYGGSWTGDWNSGQTRRPLPPPPRQGLHNGLWYY